jgi:GT2 family glycosyltransferase
VIAKQGKISANGPFIDIVIVNYNGKCFLGECLASLENSDYPRDRFEVIFVDNDSKDESVKYIKETFPWVRVLALDKNYGFAEGNNRGVQLAGGDFIFLLNSDTVVESTCISKLVKTMETDTAIGCCVPKIYLYDTPEVLDSAGSAFDNLGFCWSLRFKQEDSKEDNEVKEVPMATACALLFRRSILSQTYLFDPSFFMAYEELDFNLRMRELGYKIKLVPTARIYHRFSASQQTYFSTQPTVFKQFNSNRNRAKILAKYYPAKILLANMPIICLSFVYWDSFILKNGGFLKFFQAIWAQLSFAATGLIERWQRKDQHPERWTNFMRHHSLRELMRFGTQLSELYEGKLEV